MPSVTTEAIQVIGERRPDRGPPARGLLLTLSVLLAGLLLSVAVAGWWLQRPTPAGRLVTSFANAVDDGDAQAARRLMTDDPTIIMWPGYWSILHADLIGGERGEFEAFVAYHSALEGETELRACTSRDPAPLQPQEYDHWVRCEYTLTDALLAELADGAMGTQGRLSFGIVDGSIHTVFAARTSTPPEVFSFTEWIAEQHPEFARAKMRYTPSPPGIPRPIVVQAGLSFDAEAAHSLLAFAEEFSAPEIRR